MPSLFRFLMIIGLILAAGWAVLFGLAHGISPTPREIIVPVPLPPPPAQ